MPMGDRVTSSALIAQGTDGPLVSSPLVDGGAFFRAAPRRRASKEQQRRDEERYKKLKRAAYDALLVAERRVCDDARRRLAMSSAVVRTAVMDRALEMMTYLLDAQAIELKDQAGGITVIGCAGVGKTTLLSELMYFAAERCFKEAYGEDVAWWSYEPRNLRRIHTNSCGDVVHAQFIPVLPTTFPADMSEKTMAEMFLNSLRLTLGTDPLSEVQGRDIDPHEVLLDRIHMHGVRVLFLDEAHFVTDDRAGRTMVNQIKWLMDASPVIIIMAGVSDAGSNSLKVFEGRERDTTKAQLRTRFDLIEMLPYGSGGSRDAEWDGLIAMLGSRLLLIDQDAGFWLAPSTADYLYRRTQGVMESLIRLLRKAGLKAIGGAESISIDFLEGIAACAEADKRAAEEYGVGPNARKSTHSRQRARGDHGKTAALVVSTVRALGSEEPEA